MVFKIRLIIKININSISATEKSASLCSPDEYDISLATAVVRKRTLLKIPGIFATLPDTIITAIASPMLLPIPITTEASIPLFAAGIVILNMVSVLVAPKANEASSYSWGTARRAVSDTEIMEGSIIIAKTIIAEKRLAPSGRLKPFLTAGTRRIIPIKPYTTDGIPDSKSTQMRIMPASFPLEILAIKAAHISPIGTPMIIAPNVPYTVVSIKGSIP